MRCLSCEKFSISIICKECQEKLLIPSIYKREIKKDFINYAFYSFSEIEDLISSKYYFHGDKVYNILAKLSFANFAKEFKYDEKVYAIGIDEHTRDEFSHTSILSKHLKSKFIKPLYRQCIATNKVKYAGKDLEFRQKNKRGFKTKLTNKPVILVDDLITTGTTILEAKKVLEKNGNRVLFSLTLADAKL